mmetsp:Transcript_14135/g.33678  ORF Transcript_14135/g.33678 Transcript_14135/m.33678 type:complete len:128 (+) Transcript_14135:659-1042(+)
MSTRASGVELCVSGVTGLEDEDLELGRPPLPAPEFLRTASINFFEDGAAVKGGKAAWVPERCSARTFAFSARDAGRVGVGTRGMGSKRVQDEDSDFFERMLLRKLSMCDSCRKSSARLWRGGAPTRH